MGDDWNMIETNSFVLTSLINSLGVNDIEIEDVISFSGEYIQSREFFGLIIFLKNEPPNVSIGNNQNFSHGDIYFHSQSHKNLCQIEAILSVLLNCNHENVTLDSILSEFKNEKKPLLTCERIRQICNGFSKEKANVFMGHDPEDDEYYYYITFIPFEGHVYELNCLNKSPMDRGIIPQGSEWIEIAIPIVQQRVLELVGESKRIMAMIADPVKKYQRDLKKILDDSELSGDKREEKVNFFNTLITEEKSNRQLYQIENLRRQHNWLPFIVELLKAYAAHGILISTIEKAMAPKEVKK